jgi:hypothetical protein
MCNCSIDHEDMSTRPLGSALQKGPSLCISFSSSTVLTNIYSGHAPVKIKSAVNLRLVVARDRAEGRIPVAWLYLYTINHICRHCKCACMHVCTAGTAVRA